MKYRILVLKMLIQALRMLMDIKKATVPFKCEFSKENDTIADVIDLIDTYEWRLKVKNDG